MVMRMKRIILSALIIFLLLPSALFAAEFTATVSRNKAAIGENIALKLELSGASAKSKPTVSSLKKDFTVNAQGQSSNTTIINSVISSSTSWNYNLNPKKEGNVTIPSISIETSEGTLETEPIAISVNKASSLPSVAQNDGITISAKVSKRSPYRNEPIIYTVTLVSRYQMANVSLSELTLENAIVEPIGKPKISDGTQNGVAVKVIKAGYIITPLKSGTIKIPASTVQGAIPTRRQRKFDSFFDRNFDPFDMLGTRNLKPFAVASKPITLNVTPSVSSVTPWLPATLLEISEDWDDKQTVKVGEPLTRKFTIVAQGVSSSQLPTLENQQGNDLKVYADQPVADEKIQGDTVTSWREESYTLIPQQSGSATLPEISIAWWDVNKKKIAHAKVPARKLNVAPGDSFAPPVNTQDNVTTQQNMQPGSAPDTTTPTMPNIKQDKTLFYAVIAGLIAILLFVIFWVIKLQRKVARLTETRSPEQHKETQESKAAKSTIFGSDRMLANITTASELQKYLQLFAHERWNLPKNTPLEEIFARAQQEYPELSKDMEHVTNSIQDALYADKSLDLESAKKQCSIIVQSLGKNKKSSTEKEQKLPDLNPS